MNLEQHALTRRRFLAQGVALAATQAVPWRLVLAADEQTDTTLRPRSQALYGFPLLGDLHYDRWEHHDLDWVKADKPKDIRQIEGYVDTTKTHTPQLFRRVAAMIKSAPAPIPGVVHVGDFVEGLCGSQKLQALQFNDAMRFVEQSQLGVPFLLTKGNHDITGPGAKEAFDADLLPWMSKQLGSDLDTANYTWTQGDDLFVFFDAYQPDMDWLEGLEAKAKAARHVFFVIHPPVVPYNARSTWHVFSKEREAESRTRLLTWLGKHNAIVLSGHLHRYAMLSRKTEAGSFTQFAVCSVIRHDREQPQKSRQGVAAFDASLLELEPNFSPNSRDERLAWIEREKPFISSFDYARVPGYAMVWVYPDRVEADVYLGHAAEVWKQPSLAQPV